MTQGESEDDVIAGVVGVGEMGQHHARVYSTLSDVELAGVYDSDSERAAKIASKYGTRSVALEPLLEHVDIASIAVPTQYHYQMTKQALEFGVDVLVEKPFVNDTSQGRSLIKQAESVGALIQVGHIERFNPAVKTIHRLVQDSEIIAIDACRLGPPRTRTIEDSVVTDLMLHDLDVVSSLVDAQVTKITAISPYSGSTPPADNDYTTATLQFANGAMASLTASRTTQKTVRELTVTTRSCTIEVSYLDQHIKIYRGSDAEYAVDDGEVRYRDQRTVEIPYINTAEPLANELRSFVEAVRNNNTPEVSAETGLEIVDLAHRIEQQALTLDPQ